MKKALLLFLATVIPSATSAAEIAGSITEAQAEKAARLAPRNYPGLPQEIARDMESRGCTIPQSYVDSEPHNAIRGAFSHPGQLDWAILCSKNQRSSILIYWAGSSMQVEEIESGRREEIRIRTDSEGGTFFGFDRKIATVGEHYIVEHDKGCGGPTPPPIDHAGINDAFVEHASTVHYQPLPI